MDEEIRKELQTKLSVPLWPTAGQAPGYGRNSTYKAYANGEIPGAYRAGNKIRVATPPLRQRLHIDQQDAA